MAITKKRVYSEDGIAILREERTAADAAAWTPDNLSAGEISGGVTADDVTLDAREWSAVNLYVDFVDAGGAPHAGGTVTVSTLFSVRDDGATNGRRWKERDVVTDMTGLDVSSIDVDGHNVAFRIDALALGGATNASLKVTGGTLYENLR